MGGRPIQLGEKRPPPPLGEFLFLLAQNKATCFIVCILYKATFYGALKFWRRFTYIRRAAVTITALPTAYCRPSPTRNVTEHVTRERERERERGGTERDNGKSSCAPRNITAFGRGNCFEASLVQINKRYIYIEAPEFNSRSNSCYRTSNFHYTGPDTRWIAVTLVIYIQRVRRLYEQNIEQCLFTELSIMVGEYRGKLYVSGGRKSVNNKLRTWNIMAVEAVLVSKHKGRVCVVTGH
jgi:hypothetical protein